MKIRITDILNKYETNIDVNKIHPNLKKLVLIDEMNGVGIEDISKPKITFDKYKSMDIEKYHYKLKNISVIISWYIDDYDSISVSIEEPTPPEVRRPYYSYHINSRGEDMSVA